MAPSRSSHVLRFLIIIAALIPVAGWLRVVGERLAYRYPLEWMEGAVVAHTFRWLAGEPIYVRPSAEFIPALYPPFGYVIQGLAMRFTAPGLPAARGVSVVMSIGVALLVYLVVERRSRSRVAGLAASGLFFAAYPADGAWYDLARNDMTFLFLVLASLALTAARPRPVTSVAAAVLAALATLTRQQGVLALAIGVVHYIVTARRQALLYCIAAVLVLVPVTLLLERASAGLYLSYTWTTLGNFPEHWRRLPQLALSMLRVLLIPSAAAGLWIRAELRRRALAPGLTVWATAFAGFAGFAVLGILKEGGTTNHFIPVFAFALILEGFWFGELDRARGGARVAALGLGLVIVQTALWYQPVSVVPPPSVQAVQRRAVTEIAAFPGDVLVLEDSYYGWLAGKRLNADGGSIFWLSFLGLELPPDLVERLSTRTYAAVVLSYPVEQGIHARTRSARELNHLIADHYVLARTLAAEAPALRVLRVPRYVYVPKGE